jgi:4-hydroxy-tetrahydrodipicolinate reductase
LLFVGLGTIGLTAARMSLHRADVQVVGAVDADPQKVGHDLGFLTGWGRTHVSVTDALPEALAAQPTVAVVATTSHLASLLPTLHTLVDAGVHVVASCEELFFPWLTGGDEVEALDALAKERQVAVVGAGVNPGFVMDRLPAFVAQACVNLRGVTVRRVVDLGTRRPQLQQKAGVGLTPEEFDRLVADGKLGHVGLAHSAAFLAAALGIKLSRLTETIRPLPDAADIVRGIEHIASGWEGEYERVRLELQMVMGAANPRDEVEIDADPPLHLIVHGGVAGDEATAAILVNTATWVDQLPPGVHAGAAWVPRLVWLPVTARREKIGTDGR